MRYQRANVLLLSRYVHHTKPIFKELVSKTNVKWIGCRIPRKLTKLTLLPIFLYESLLGLAFILISRPRVIVGYYLGLESLIAILLKHIARSKVVLFSIGSDVEFKGKIHYTILRYIVQKSDLIVCISREIEKKVQSLGARLTKVIPTIPNFYDFKTIEDRDKEYDVVNIGYVVPVKHQELLIDACDELPWIKIAIIGDGPLLNRLILKAKKVRCKIKFTGKVQHEEIWRFLQKSKIYVHTSFREGVSAAILEAIYCGLPVIVVEAEYVSFLLELGFNIVIAKRDPLDLALTIKKVLDNYSHYARLALENRKKLLNMISSFKKELLNSILN